MKFQVSHVSNAIRSAKMCQVTEQPAGSTAMAESSGWYKTIKNVVDVVDVVALGSKD